MAMLAEKRQKVRWILNPKQTEWSSDSNKFGQRLLEQMGWKAGCGLGTNLQGATEHVKVSVRSDNRGIGFKDRPEDVLPHQIKFAELLAQLAVGEQPIEHVQKKVFSLESQSRESRARIHYHKFTRSKDVSRYSQKDLECILGKPVTPNEALNVGACNSSIPSRTLWVRDTIDQEENLSTKLHASKKKHMFEAGEDYSINTVDSEQLKVVHDYSLELQESPSRKKRGGNQKSIKDSSEQQTLINGDVKEPKETSCISIEPSRKKQKRIKEYSVSDDSIWDSCEKLKVMSEYPNNVSEENSFMRKKRKIKKEGSEESNEVQNLTGEKFAENSSIYVSTWVKQEVSESNEECLPDKGCLKKRKVKNENSKVPIVTLPRSHVETLKEKKKHKKFKEEIEESLCLKSSNVECVPVAESITLPLSYVETLEDEKKKKKKKKHKKFKEENEESLCLENTINAECVLVAESITSPLTHVDTLKEKKKKKQKIYKEENEESLCLENTNLECVSVAERSMDLQEEELGTESVDIQQKRLRKKNKKLTANFVSKTTIGSRSVGDDSLIIENIKDRKKKRSSSSQESKQECDTSTTDFSQQEVKCKKSVRFSKDCEIVLIPSLKEIRVQNLFSDSQSNDLSTGNTSQANKIELSSITLGATPANNIKTKGQKSSLVDTEHSNNQLQNHSAKQKYVSNVCGGLQEEIPTDCLDIKKVTKHHKILLNGVKYVNGIAKHLGHLPRKMSYASYASKSIPYWQRKDVTVNFPGTNLGTLGYGYHKQFVTQRRLN